MQKVVVLRTMKPRANWGSWGDRVVLGSRLLLQQAVLGLHYQKGGLFVIMLSTKVPVKNDWKICSST